jgi:hypothetical protein
MAANDHAKNILSPNDKALTMLVASVTNTIIPEIFSKIFANKPDEVVQKLIKKVATDDDIIDKIRTEFAAQLADFYAEVLEQERKTNPLKKPKKPKKPIDPNAPKKPKSAWLIFTAEWRDKIKKNNPNLSLGEVTKELGELWSEFKENGQAEPYAKAAGADKKRYEKEFANYSPSEEFQADLEEYNQNREKPERKRKRKKPSDPNKPKRPLGAYFTFCADHRDQVRAENPDSKAIEISKILGNMWKTEIDTDTKNKYKAEAKTKMDEWKAQFDQSAKKPAEKKSAKKPAEKKSAKKPAEKKSAKKPAEKKSAKKPAEKKSAKKPAEKKSAKKPAEKKSVKKPAKKKSAKKPVEVEVESEDNSDLWKIIDEASCGDQVEGEGESESEVEVVEGIEEVW